VPARNVSDLPPSFTVMPGEKRRRGACTFKQSDVTRALKAAKAAGFEHVQVRIDRGGAITILAGGGTAPDLVSRDEAEPSKWADKHGY
jgi:hypothetical protein